MSMHIESGIALAKRNRPRFARAMRSGQTRPWGVGYGMGHHGEILQGVFQRADGSLARGLVSLVVPSLRSRAVFKRSAAPLTVEPAWKTKSLCAAELVLDRFNAPHAGTLTISSRIAPRLGFGSSTCDVIASMRAVARALGKSLTADVLAQLAVQAELACDSTMFGDRALLFAQRRGYVIEDLGGWLPKVHVVGFNADPASDGVATLTMPPARYNSWEIEAFRPLLSLMRRAVQQQDAAALGQVASGSARINQRFLPTHGFQKLEWIVETVGALGLQVAHSGTLAGILLPDDDSVEERRAETSRYLHEAGIPSCWHFTTHESV